MRRRWRCVGALVVVVLAVGGCGDDGDADDDGASATPTSTMSEGSSYVASVNERCEAMIPEIVAINGDESQPVAATFIEKNEQKAAVYEVFDAEIDALPVGPSDQRAADAFDAYRDSADADAEALAAVAATGDAVAFDAKHAELLAAFRSSPVTAELDAVGIDCPAR